MINQVPPTDARAEDGGVGRTAGEDGGRRLQIVDAALHVMVEHGFRGASIKRIAQRAGLKSPALIYWYFRDKQALFEAVLHRMAPFLDTVAQAEASLDDPPDQVLPMVVSGFLSGFQQPATGRMMRLLLSEVVRHPQIANIFAERGPLVVLRFLERYLQRQIDLGRLHQHDPRGAARALMGMLLVYALGREILPPVGAGFPPAEDYSKQVTDIFLSGLRSDAAARTPRPN
jgi:TetR/AcrR family transcriptional regulator